MIKLHCRRGCWCGFEELCGWWVPRTGKSLSAHQNLEYSDLGDRGIQKPGRCDLPTQLEVGQRHTEAIKPCHSCEFSSDIFSQLSPSRRAFSGHALVIRDPTNPYITRSRSGESNPKPLPFTRLMLYRLSYSDTINMIPRWKTSFTV